MKPVSVSRRQDGVVLVIVLVLLASMTLMATAGVQSSIMGLKISRNVEEIANAFQAAQSAIDFVISDTGNLPMTGPLNDPVAVAVNGTPFEVDTTAGETIEATAERTIDCGVPPRIGLGSSILAYSTFSFRVSAEVDRTATGRGRSSLREGYMVLGPKC
jgi:hypothetical protein